MSRQYYLLAYGTDHLIDLQCLAKLAGTANTLSKIPHASASARLWLWKICDSARATHIVLNNYGRDGSPFTPTPDTLCPAQ